MDASCKLTAYPYGTECAQGTDHRFDVACAAIDAMRPFVYATNAHRGLDAHATDALLRAMRGCIIGSGLDGWVADAAMDYLSDNGYDCSAREAIRWALQESIDYTDDTDALPTLSEYGTQAN